MESAMASTYTLRTNNETAASFHVAGQVSQRLAPHALFGENLPVKFALGKGGRGRPHRFNGFDSGRDGNGKGADCPRDPRPFKPLRASLYSSELRGNSPVADHFRVVRS